jgi:hypothetical protein
MTLTDAQLREWDKGPPIEVSGEQTQAQAEALRIEDFRRVCELEGLFPLPSDDDVKIAIAENRLLLTPVKYNTDVSYTYWYYEGRYMRIWSGKGKTPSTGTAYSFWDGEKWAAGEVPSENELDLYSRVTPPIPGIPIEQTPS